MCVVVLCGCMCFCVCVCTSGALQKIENWKLCCNLQPYQISILVLISEAQHTHTHIHARLCLHTEEQLKVPNLAHFSHPLFPKSLYCHLTQTHMHTQSSEKDRLVMVFDFVIGIPSVAERQVKGVEFRKLGLITSQRARATARTWSLASLATAPTAERRGIRNEWAGRVIAALSTLAGRRSSWLPYKQFTCLIDWH